MARHAPARAAVTALVAAAALFAPAAADPLAAFQPPVAATFAANADLQTPIVVPDAATCATACLARDDCISFNLCGAAGSFRCGVSGWNVSYVPAAAASCSWWRRTIPRNDTYIVQAVPWLLAPPTRGVSLNAGPIADAFRGNVDLYLRVRDPLDMLHFFSLRAGAAPVGACFGWDEWIKGSATGNFLMGVGGALRWMDDAALSAAAATVVEGIAQYAMPDGWLWAFNESDIGADNLPDYCASWVTRGLLDVAGAGIPGALALARQSIDTFNNHSSLPFFLPPNGGPNPVQPFPSGFNNVSSGGYGQVRRGGEGGGDARRETPTPLPPPPPPLTPHTTHHTTTSPALRAAHWSHDLHRVSGV